MKEKDAIVCGMGNDGGYAYNSDRYFCSLAPGHGDDVPHRAYRNHVVTGKGRDILWLGPWNDKTPWEDAESERLADEWANRWDDPEWLANNW